MNNRKKKSHKSRGKFFLACLSILVLGGIVATQNWEQLKASLPTLVDAFIVEYDETKQDHGMLVDAINKSTVPTVDNPDLPYHMTLMPKRLSGDSATPPIAGEIADVQVIPGEYGFSPIWNRAAVEEGGSQAIVTRKGGAPYVTVKTSEAFQVADMETAGKPVENSIIFTNMGTYRGKQIDVKMTVVSMAEVMVDGKNVSRGVQIGTGSERADSDPSDVNPNSAMSVKNTGAETYTKSATPGYVEINYTFYEHPTEYNPLQFSSNDPHLPGKTEPVAIQGFLTFVDFDFNESLGISNDANINRIYTLKTQEGDADWRPEWEAIDLFAPISANPLEKQLYYDYFAYRFPLAVGSGARNNMNINELTYRVVPASEKDSGYLYINRFSYANTRATARANWFSFTYGETKSFNINFNANYFYHNDNEYSPKSSNAVFKELLSDPLNELPNKERYYEMISRSNGSAIGFFPQTLGPIKFSNPIKKADQETSDKRIDWTIRQDVAPRYVKNGEPQFIIEDEFPPVLRVEQQSIKIEDAYGQDVTNHTFRSGNSDVKIWDIQVTNTGGKDKLVVSANKEYLKLTGFYQNAYTVSVSTTLDETQDYLTEEYLDVANNQLKFANSATLKMVDVDFSESNYLSQPDYGQPVEATIGRMDLYGQIEIEKRGESPTGPLLAGATFEIRDQQGVKVDGGTTGVTGKWLSKDLPGGIDYRVVETKAPSGYDKAADSEGVRVSFTTNRLVVVDPIIRPIGTLAVKKAVFDELGTAINDERVGLDQVLTYEIKIGNSHSDGNTLLRDVTFSDSLPSSLDLIPNSTLVSGSAITSGEVDPSEIGWDETGSTLALKTLKNQVLSGNKEIVVTFKAKVNQSASGSIENIVVAKAVGRIENQEEPKELEAQASVVNYLSVTIHLRQVIQGTNGALVKPLGAAAGYFSLDSLSQDKRLGTVNKRVISTDQLGETVYTATDLLPEPLANGLEIKAVIPEMYDYIGYLISEQPDQVISELKTGVPKVTITSDKTYYVSLVLQVRASYSNQSVPFYNWSYLLNEFSQGIKVN